VLRPGIVHRLDKDTSGVLVAAKTDAAHQGLSALFAAHDLERRYLALLARRPDPPAGRIETQIGRARFDRQRMAVLKSGGRRAETRYRVLETFQTGSHPPRALACKAALELQTGRTHQIRVHMAHLGAAVLADPLYGSSAPAGPVREAIAAAGLRRQALHAQRLAFHHPVTGERLAFETDPPEDMGRLETELRSRFFSV
jgi:23S rRNA pseudouridine1911/1915/1917 synthase